MNYQRGFINFEGCGDEAAFFLGMLFIMLYKEVKYEQSNQNY